MQTIRSNHSLSSAEAHDIAQSRGPGWSAHAATVLARERKHIALIGLLLACLLFVAVVAPESAAARIPAPTEQMSPWFCVLAIVCLCMLGIGSLMLAYVPPLGGELLFAGRWRLNTSDVVVAVCLICIPLVVLEVWFYGYMGLEWSKACWGIFVGALRSFPGLFGFGVGKEGLATLVLWLLVMLLLLACVVLPCLVPILCILGASEVHVDVRLISFAVVAAALPPVVALFWMVGRRSIVLMFTCVARGGLHAVDIINFTGSIWAVYSLALLFLFRWVLHGLVSWICRLVQASPAVREAKSNAVVQAWNRWMSLYLLGWAIVVCAQLVATILHFQQLFRSAPALMMTIVAPQIPLIAACELMPFRFVKAVSQMQLAVLVSSAGGLVAAVVRGYQGGGVVSPVAGGTGVGTLVSILIFAIWVLLSMFVDRVRQNFRNSELQRDQAFLQTVPAM